MRLRLLFIFALAAAAGLSSCQQQPPPATPPAQHKALNELTTRHVKLTDRQGALVASRVKGLSEAATAELTEPMQLQAQTLMHLRKALELVEFLTKVPGDPKVAYTHVYGAPGISGVTILSR